ncbi:MAG: hypothetical protein EBT75_00240 [Proteobacteria bacterium]|nr:hypothetical protein [Pseudomonadota bacterium]
MGRGGKVTSQKVLLGVLAAAVLVTMPVKFGTTTRGNQFKKGTKAPAAEVVGAVIDKDAAAKLKALETPDPLASQVTHPKKGEQQ